MYRRVHFKISCVFAVIASPSLQNQVKRRLKPTLETLPPLQNAKSPGMSHPLGQNPPEFPPYLSWLPGAILQRLHSTKESISHSREARVNTWPGKQ